MAKISKNSATIIVIIVSVSIVLSSKFVIGSMKKDGVEGSTAKVKGSEDAPIRVVEYIDFQCPACAHGAAYLKKMIEDYPDAIRLELKHYPLQMHRHGFLSSRYAECAAQQGKFWDFQDTLLARQNNWKRLADAVPAFDQIASETGIDPKALKGCLDDDAVDEIINQNKEEGKASGLRSTPTYYINDEMFVGRKSLEAELTRLLEEYGY